MKCPKCGYLGFETSDRCRNCGYDFSLAAQTAPLSELPLNAGEGAGAPLQDFDLDSFSTTETSTSTLDLDRMIGAPEPATPATPKKPTPRPARSAPNTSGVSPLPFDAGDDVPLITAPRPPRPPLSVRRTTPEIPRVRTRPKTPRTVDSALGFQVEPETDTSVEPSSTEPAIDDPAATPAAAVVEQASPAARLGAALLDGVLLGAIDAAVVYLTLAMAGLRTTELGILPLAPLVTFLVILDGAYLVGFIAASGQTIGKMLMNIRVTRDDGRRVDIPGAALRAVGCGLSLLTAGLGYLPAFVTSDGRALHDRISRTRVVSAR
jgi:uncharacterized RDD family membrane protein YckC